MGIANRSQASIALLGSPGAARAAMTSALRAAHRDTVDGLTTGGIVGAVLVVDVDDGVTSAVRADVEAAARERVPVLGALVHVPAGGDQELGDLLEVEVRELLAKHRLGGDSTPVGFSADALSAKLARPAR
jgi:translation elongation factor EF-Tu-like GTPase